jgi:hypothetical protein
VEARCHADTKETLSPLLCFAASVTFLIMDFLADSVVCKFFHIYCAWLKGSACFQFAFLAMGTAPPLPKNVETIQHANNEDCLLGISF